MLLAKLLSFIHLYSCLATLLLYCLPVILPQPPFGMRDNFVYNGDCSSGTGFSF